MRGKPFSVHALLKDRVGALQRNVRWSLRPRQDLRHIRRIEIFSGEESSNLIRRLFEEASPFLVSRLGTTEMKAILSQARVQSDPEKAVQASQNLSNLSGVFPEGLATLSRFASTYSHWIEQVDVLGVRDQAHEYKFRKLESFCVRRYFRGSNLISIEDLFPVDHHNPWSASLEGRRVLVIHPFESSIRKQAPNLKAIFPDGQVPEMNLRTFRPPQLLARSKERKAYQSWFDAFDQSLLSLKNLADNFKPEVALIGAGALGLGYGSQLKEWGYSSIHVGGVLQLFFGIQGRRWDHDPRIIRLGQNDAWRRPALDEIPEGAETVEGGIYW